MALANRDIMAQASFMGPRHGKSEFRSKMFPAWYLMLFPHHRVILVSHGSDFAAEWGMKVRDLLEQWGTTLFNRDVRIRPDRRAADSWEIAEHGGGMQTCGVGGSLVGKGADLLLLDDTIKSAEEALSPTFRQKQWDWYISTADTRLEPNAIKCMTMTRWHEDDLCGRIMAAEGDRWDVLSLPAIAEEDDPLGRPVGAALWPERYPIEELERLRARDPFWFEALYQCHPRPRDGGMFKEAWFEGRTVARPPQIVRSVRHWDKAATQGGGDFTVGLKMSEGVDGRFYIEHVTRGQWGEYPRDQEIQTRAREDGIDCEISGEQEPGSAGKDAGSAFVRMLAGYVVQVRVATGSKEVRAAALASQCQAGNVFLVAGDWNGPFLRELCAFPSGKFDDQVDAASGAFNRLVGESLIGTATWGPDPFGGRRW